MYVSGSDRSFSRFRAPGTLLAWVLLSACAPQIRALSQLANENLDVAPSGPGFVDDFDSGSLSARWMKMSDAGSYIGGDASSSVTNSGSALLIGDINASGGGQGIETTNDFDFTGASLQAELTSPPVDPLGGHYRESGIWFTNAAGDGFEFYAESGGTLAMGTWIDSTGTSDTTNIPYDSVAHRFLRIRHDASADTMNFETSPDAVTWTIRRSMARGSIAIDADHLIIYGFGWGGSDGSDTATWDNFRTDALEITP